MLLVVIRSLDPACEVGLSLNEYHSNVAQAVRQGIASRPKITASKLVRQEVTRLIKKVSMERKKTTP